MRSPYEVSAIGDLVGARADQRPAGAGGRRRVGDVGLGDLDLLEDEGQVGRRDGEALADGRHGRLGGERHRGGLRAPARTNPSRPPRTSRSSRRSSRAARRRSPMPRAARVEAVHPPDREHVRRRAACDEDHVLRECELRRSAGGHGIERRCVTSRVELVAPETARARRGSVEHRGVRRPARRRPRASRVRDSRRMATICLESIRISMTRPLAVTRYVYDFDEPADGRPRAPRRQGRRPRRDDAARRPGARRLHDHDRRLPRVHGEGGLPDGLEDEVAEHIARLEKRTGKRFGDTGDPLLVSVRSGAAVSMPGMMDTILNLGPQRRRGRRASRARRATRASRATPTGG